MAIRRMVCVLRRWWRESPEERNAQLTAWGIGLLAGLTFVGIFFAVGGTVS